MLRSLWFRLTGTVVAVVAVTLTVALVAFVVITRRELVQFIDETAQAVARVAEQATTAEPSQELELIDPMGQRRIIVPDPVLREFASEIPRVVQSEGSEFLSTVSTTVLGSILFSGILAIMASTWLFWQITRPLARLRDAAESIAQGDLEARVPVKSKDEVGRVSLAFNHMAGELQRQEGLRKRMVADVAHELRTPLSVMRGNLEAMMDELIPASAEELGAIHYEVLRLARLVEDLRLLSLADAGELRLDARSLDSGEMVEMAIRRMTPLAQAKGITLVGDISGATTPFLGDEDKIQQVLANLIANAIRYSPPDGRVTVRAVTVNGAVEMVVADEGPGVNQEELPHLFERLWRGDRSRRRNGAGSGLGLSIVKQLVDLHGGQVSATLPKSGGLQVTIRLPAPG